MQLYIVRLSACIHIKYISPANLPVAIRRQLNDLPDELWTKINIEFYKNSADAVFKALVE